MTEQYNWNARLRAIAINAVREAMLAQNRSEGPFNDDDAARVDTIYELLHLQNPALETTYVHASLAPAVQSPISEALPKIADILAGADAITERQQPKITEIALPRSKSREAVA